jgi:hypothetical protein
MRGPVHWLARNAIRCRCRDADNRSPQSVIAEKQLFDRPQGLTAVRSQFRQNDSNHDG